ncbi:thiolase [Achromobacter sp. HZ01]|uniref:acetyl-CoA acetyltransferase n=1 Tax=Achromobacter sp. HZ01 TaxID=1416886 RepID=UPI000DC45577|nr:acetyl-CoA acetyltransferase [Achromobacter sp. HZ01]RAP65396.1 thiolase [Achromobacter sp. HZ01]
MNDDFRPGRAVVAGAAESDLGAVGEAYTALDLMAQGVYRALDDCGLSIKDVDGLFCATTQSRLAGLALAEYLQLPEAYIDSTSTGGSSFMGHLARAEAAIAAGLCEVAVVAYGSTQRSLGRKNTSRPEWNPYESPYKPFLPATAYAMAAARHMHEFGTTREQLAEVAVAARQWALLNPVAWEREPLTVEGVLSSRMVSHPLTIRDCCLVSDGGGALVLTTPARARGLRTAPVYLLGSGHCSTHLTISNMPDLVNTGARVSGEIAYAQAGLTASDMDVVGLYDAFTINTVLFLEDLGFCAKGEGGAFVANGRIAPGGQLPVNTNGGGLSYCHPGMYGIFLLIEAVRQLRGECGRRQVEGAEVALAHGNGGVLSSQYTVILGGASTV